VNNVVHMITWAIEANGPFPCNDRCGLAYNHSSRRNPDGSYQNCVQGLLGAAAGTGPDGNEPSGWWNDDVAPVIVADASNTVYVAWRGWTPTGEGRITKVNDAEFTQTCSDDPTCGGQVCIGTQFCPSINRRRWWNCEMAPAKDRGVYVAWDDGGTAWLRSVGVTTDNTPGDFDRDHDVDQEDFGRLQQCLGEDGIRFPEGCDAQDLDRDGDVDPDDFSAFQECFAGPANPPACSDSN
jgi:hypothetical protein